MFHATNGVVFAAALTWWPYGTWTATAALWTVVAVLLAVDALRFKVPAVNRVFFRVLRPFASPREARGVASSTWYAIGIATAVTVTPIPVAVSGILVMALADPAASYYGQRWGRRPFLGGSLEGSLVFFVVALAVLLPRHGLWIALGVAVPVTVLERRSWPLDDNLTVPVVSALLVWLLDAWG
jgi:dolichol kinase